jgi:uncharacterized protein (DUF302 family)
MSYYYKKQVALTFAETTQRTKTLLTEQGFGILMELNVNEILQKKLGVEFGNYVILGACSPRHAYEALQAEIDIGLLLPCNLVVYQDQTNRVFVSAIKPSVALGLVSTPGLANIAGEVEAKLKKVVDLI